MAGFGAFRDPTTIDFSDADFFVLVGPTGSGKSTIIDAVCFALYGSVPRYENKGLIRYTVTLGAAEARVSLTFELEESTYVASRVVRRQANGQVTTKEARLERLESDGQSTVLAGAEREMAPAVTELLRLDFDDFTRCVVLPQNQFASFLRAKGDERRDLLMKLLNLNVYLQVGSLAGRRADSALAEANVLRQRLDNLNFATPDALKEAKGKATSIDRLVKQAEKARPDIENALRQAEEQSRREAEARDFVAKLSQIRVPAKATKYGAELRAAQKEFEATQTVLATASTERQMAETATAGLADLVQLQRALEAHQSLGQTAESLDKARAKVQLTSGTEESATQKLGLAEAELEAAQTEVKRMETEHRAEDLAQSLVVGEPCPVCLQVVKERPYHHAPKGLAKARKAEKDAREVVKTARSALDTAIKASAEVRGTVTGLERERVELEAKVLAHPDVAALKAAIVDTRDKLTALEVARKSEGDAAVKATGTQRALDQLRTAGNALQSQFNAQRDTVAALESPRPEYKDLLTDWGAMAEWAAAAGPLQADVAEKAAAAVTKFRQDVEARLQTLVNESAELGVKVEKDVVKVLTALARAAADAKAEAKRISDAIQEAKSLTRQVAELDAQRQVASELRNLLRANRFPEWLITEALELLVIDASDTLRKLTNDEFSLALGEQEFMVIDHANADERRSARTLSGGETFQASLALALALSDQIRSLAAEGAPMLDALFLDEGFGTLDPETLETVAGTIENLGQAGRMVGIITHVRELADRVPVRFEVQKGPRTSTVERRAA